jgi:hypothetical protein
VYIILYRFQLLRLQKFVVYYLATLSAEFNVIVVMGQYRVTLIMATCLLTLTVRCEAARLCDTQLVHATFLACGMAKRSSLPPLFFPHHSDDDNMLQSSDVVSFAKRLENQGLSFITIYRLFFLQCTNFQHNYNAKILTYDTTICYQWLQLKLCAIAKRSLEISI